MEAGFRLRGQLSETYHRTLELAKSISKNRYQYFDEEIHTDHLKFLRRVTRGCKEFSDLENRFTKTVSIKTQADDAEILFRPEPAEAFKVAQRPSAKLKLGEMINESYKLACTTRTGRGGIRHLTPSPSPILEKLKNNKSTFTETSLEDEKPVTYISLINGKTEEIELPSFKDCVTGNKRIDSQSEMTLNKIEKCKEKLENFEKEINGLEVFCKANPGVQWKTDKKLLLKLASGVGNRASLIKAYNEKNGADKKESRGTHSGISPVKHFSLKMPKIEERRSRSVMPREKTGRKYNCFSAFKQIKAKENLKMLQIIEKIKGERPEYLRKKASLIISDNEMYKGKIHSFQTLEKFKKTVEKQRQSNLSKCKEQISVYTKLLDHLKKIIGMPSQLMISFVEAIREMLEGGWLINTENFSELLEIYSSSEKSELKDLIEIITDYFSKTSLIL